MSKELIGMNRTYKSIFNHNLGAWQAVPETARTRSKGQRCATRRARRPSVGHPLRRRLLVASSVLALTFLISAPVVLADPTVIPEDQEIFGEDGEENSLDHADDGGTAYEFSGDALVNDGTIFGGKGGDSNWGDGGRGGDGVDFAGNDFVNHGTIFGGNGGNGGWGYGGRGGDGVDFTGNDFVNHGTIFGGGGGDSGRQDGGRGGDGVYFTGDVFVNHGTVAGGDGKESPQADGGDGGTAVIFSGNALTNEGDIAGGDGGDSTRELTAAGNGGSGLIVTNDGAHVDNAGSISGATGGELAWGRWRRWHRGDLLRQCARQRGRHCRRGGGDNSRGPAGSGGSGLVVTNDGAHVDNAGSISGGDGGENSRGDGGDGGTAVIFSGNALTNEGNIVGGTAAIAHGRSPAAVDPASS
ncbi:ESPR domain-containing protein [Alkalilimnicola ehrlichii]|uniref:ESPR domain-containing protein n=1 Tax=Alkalilimnicola ehrlichii TaxID=351052 RepID=A0A3E0WKD3_9GAMM|nr:ESPR domain-containing protein [Alkalilimnicola ehrlichii]RFA33248.1 hypothetical protein CAL65_17925 [Alkalilimnicola ehrlichii]